MLKADLRKEMLLKRLSYSTIEIEDLSRQICKRFFDYFSLNQIRTIHVFLPIQRKNEVDTWQIIRHLEANFPEIHIAVSVSDLKDYSLTHYQLKPQTKLVENKWGIAEPEGADTIPVEQIDMVLVPLLAFDEKGHRVGYGKGFYDRFLAACRPDVLKIGLSIEPAIYQIADVHEDDILLDYAITPSLVFKFR